MAGVGEVHPDKMLTNAGACAGDRLVLTKPLGTGILATALKRDALLETGVTAYLPTFVTAPEEQVLAALREVPVTSDGPRVLGAHLEGPFLSELRLGIHRAGDRRDPDVELLERLLDAGPVRLMTLAPELSGADALIEHLLRHEVAVSCGHSDATAEEANAAFDAGVRSVTHLFNAMRPFRHRDPGIAGAALARDDVVVHVILDGVHLAPETASVVWRAAAGRVALVTDAMAGAGLTDGSYRLAGLEIEILDGHRVRVGTAVPDVKVATAAAEAGIDGLWFYRGIPGGIGATGTRRAGTAEPTHRGRWRRGTADARRGRGRDSRQDGE